MVSEHGNYMDPLADKVLMIGALSALLVLDTIQLWPYIIIIGRDIIITIYRNYLIPKINRLKHQNLETKNSVSTRYGFNNIACKSITSYG